VCIGIEHTTFRGQDRHSPSGLSFPKLNVLLFHYLRCGEARNRIIRRTVDIVVGIAQLVLLYRKLASIRLVRSEGVRYNIGGGTERLHKIA